MIFSRRSRPLYLPPRYRRGWVGLGIDCESRCGCVDCHAFLCGRAPCYIKATLTGVTNADPCGCCYCSEVNRTLWFSPGDILFDSGDSCRWSASGCPGDTGPIYWACSTTALKGLLLSAGKQGDQYVISITKPAGGPNVFDDPGVNWLVSLGEEPIDADALVGKVLTFSSKTHAPPQCPPNTNCAGYWCLYEASEWTIDEVLMDLDDELPAGHQCCRECDVRPGPEELETLCDRFTWQCPPPDPGVFGELPIAVAPDEIMVQLPSGWRSFQSEAGGMIVSAEDPEGPCQRKACPPQDSQCADLDGAEVALARGQSQSDRCTYRYIFPNSTADCYTQEGDDPCGVSGQASYTRVLTLTLSKSGSTVTIHAELFMGRNNPSWEGQFEDLLDACGNIDPSKLTGLEIPYLQTELGGTNESSWPDCYFGQSDYIQRVLGEHTGFPTNPLCIGRNCGTFIAAFSALSGPYTGEPLTITGVVMP